MRILLVNRYYGGQHVPTGRMLQDLAEELSRRGYEVDVLTSAATYAPTDTPLTGTGTVIVRRLWTGGSSRVLSWLLFWLQISVRIPWTRWERCVVLTDPPFMIAVAWLARTFGQPKGFYWWTMDLYPEALVANGLLPSGSWRNRLLAWVNEVGLRSAAGVICLGQRQRQRLAAYKNFR